MKTHWYMKLNKEKSTNNSIVFDLNRWWIMYIKLIIRLKSHLYKCSRKNKYYYCQSQIEGGKFCLEQCDHCKEYYAQMEEEKRMYAGNNLPYTKDEWDDLKLLKREHDKFMDELYR